MKTACLYHADLDGWGSAYSLWKALKATNELLFIEVQYGQEPPYEALREFGPDRVYIVDFSYKAPVLKDFLNEFPETMVIDHHNVRRKSIPYISFFKFKIHKQNHL